MIIPFLAKKVKRTELRDWFEVVRELLRYFEGTLSVKNNVQLKKFVRKECRRLQKLYPPYVAEKGVAV